MRKLPWLPDVLRPPKQLTSEIHRAWWEAIKDAMIDNDSMQGYLPKTDDLWRIAGARTRAFWNANCAAVTACFNSATVSGQEVIFYAPLVELIEAQNSKLRGSKRARGLPSNSTSQSEFDFDSKKSNGTNSENSSAKKPSHSHYSQADFDARDLRRLADAYKGIEQVAEKQPWLTADDLLEMQARRAGVPFERAVELLRKTKHTAAGE